jgi:hypothetical protein
MIQSSQINAINNALQYFSDSITCFKDTISKEQVTLPNARALAS